MAQIDASEAPWIDKQGYRVADRVKALASDPEVSALHDQLQDWHSDGLVIFRAAIDSELIDSYLQDIETLKSQARSLDVLVNCETQGIIPIRQLSREEVEQPTLRILDFHNASTAGKKLVLSRPILAFLEQVFADQVVAMQSLTFLRGSQQPTHQDLPFVVAEKPHFLAAAWIALEDIHPDAGPLGYYVGSHRLPLYDFGNGPFLTSESPRREAEFRDYLESSCAANSMPFAILEARKGDVMIWHALLAHAGTPVNNPNLTRRTLVAHYSAAHAYTRERRQPDTTPRRQYHNGGFCYADPIRPHLENTFCAAGPIDGDTPPAH